MPGTTWELFQYDTKPGRIATFILPHKWTKHDPGTHQPSMANSTFAGQVFNHHNAINNTFQLVNPTMSSCLLSLHSLGSRSLVRQHLLLSTKGSWQCKPLQSGMACMADAGFVMWMYHVTFVVDICPKWQTLFTWQCHKTVVCIGEYKGHPQCFQQDSMVIKDNCSCDKYVLFITDLDVTFKYSKDTGIYTQQEAITGHVWWQNNIVIKGLQ